VVTSDVGWITGFPAMSLSRGTKLGRYEIRSQLGAGGMGEVYRAYDLKINREVAIKVLPAAFSADKSRLARFEQEAQAAGALNHPNIITIHEIGEAEGRPYIATEFVQGQTLRRRMQQPLTVMEALEAAVQMASALSAAHGAGIIHRDLKPENVMLRPDGLVKVVDFGLAKLTPRKPLIIDATASTLPVVNTDSGVIVGTVAYMSPEQARGLEVGASSDIFSFGVTLYEMVAGRPPFEGPTPSDLIASILKSEPPPLKDCADDVPPELERIVSKALRKDPEMRYQSINDLLADLRNLKRDLESTAYRQPITHRTSPVETIVSAVRGHKLASLLALLLIVSVAVALRLYLHAGNSESPINSIGVLPFTNGGDDRIAEYLSDGITEELINRLSQLPQLRVPARATMFRYKGKDLDPQEVGRKLGVSALLMGRVTQGENGLIIQVDLVSVAQGSQLWGAHYNGRPAEIQSMREEIVRDVSKRLRLRLNNEQEQRLVKRDTKDSEAYDLYLKGHYHLEKRTEDGIKRAIDFFQQAIARDSEFALAYAGLADCYILGGNALPWPETEVRLKAKDAALKALARDDTLAEAHTSLAVVSMLYDWNWSMAEREFKRAIELNPNYVTAHHWYAEYLAAMARHDQAFSEITLAQKMDPLSVIISRDVGMHYYYAGQYDQAIEQARNTLALDSNFNLAHKLLGLAYMKKGQSDLAITELLEVLKNSTSGQDRAMLAQAYALSGKRAEAMRLLNELRSKDSISPYYIAVIYAGLGDQQRAFESLERAYREQVSSLVYLNVDPRLESLRPDPRFRALAKRIGLPE
jgi:serine/threonine protein kinase/lipoprotein NlpI